MSSSSSFPGFISKQEALEKYGLRIRVMSFLLFQRAVVVWTNEEFAERHPSQSFFVFTKVVRRGGKAYRSRWIGGVRISAYTDLQFVRVNVWLDEPL